MSREKLIKEIAEINRLIHEPARLAIMAALYGVQEADFLYLLNLTGLTKGNLSAHVSRLEEAGYVEVEKKFVGKKPMTLYRMTEKGRAAFRDYLKFIRQMGELGE